MDLDEEAKRLAAAHPWADALYHQRHTTEWQPQHAVPRRPAVAKPLDADIEARVAADLARLDRELDPHRYTYAPDPLLVRYGVDFGAIDRDQWEAMARNLSNRMLNPPKSGPGRQKQTKTYETPNRRAKRSVKASMSWIDRAKQSADARKR